VTDWATIALIAGPALGVVVAFFVVAVVRAARRVRHTGRTDREDQP
jgi:cation transporter-like permease